MLGLDLADVTLQRTRADLGYGGDVAEVEVFAPELTENLNQFWVCAIATAPTYLELFRLETVLDDKGIEPLAATFLVPDVTRQGPCRAASRSGSAWLRVGSGLPTSQGS